MNPQDPLKSAPVITTVSGREMVRDQDKIMLVLAYVGILALFPLLTVKDSPYVTWHAKQGLALLAAGVIGYIGIGIVTALPFLHCVGVLAWLAFSIALLVVDVVAMAKALNGERWRVPVVANIADKF